MVALWLNMDQFLSRFPDSPWRSSYYLGLLMLFLPTFRVTVKIFLSLKIVSFIFICVCSVGVCATKWRLLLLCLREDAAHFLKWMFPVLLRARHCARHQSTVGTVVSKAAAGPVLNIVAHLVLKAGENTRIKWAKTLWKKQKNQADMKYTVRRPISGRMTGENHAEGTLEKGWSAV